MYFGVYVGALGGFVSVGGAGCDQGATLNIFEANFAPQD